MPIRFVVLVWSVLLVAGCSTSPKAPATANAAREALTDDLPGTKGATRADQERIDNTVAGGCGAAIWPRAVCRRHNKVARQ